jgi:KEOPS complex subunit Cgi121
MTFEPIGGSEYLTEISKFEEYGTYFIAYCFYVKESLDADNFLKYLREVSSDLEVQIVDLDRIAGRRHLYFAALNAVHAFEKGTNISRTLAVEFLLYASAQKQISEAIKMMGLNQNSRNIGVIAIGRDEQLVRRFAERLPSLTNACGDDTLPDQWSEEKIENLLSIFKIPKKELQAMSGKKTPKNVTIQKLIIERVALLPTMV